MFERLKKVVEVFSAGRALEDKISGGGTNAGRRISNSMVNMIIGMSNFDELDEEDIFEQMYAWEPEVGGGIDRMGTMVGQCFQYCYALNPEEVMNPDNPEQNEPNTDMVEEMVRMANFLTKKLKYKSAAAVYGELLSMMGNAYIRERPDLSLEVLPNKEVTLLDEKWRTDNPVQDLKKQVMTEVNWVCLYEDDPNMREYVPIEQCYVMRLRDTPVYVTDSRGRKTFGMYAVSPLQRAILPVWQKRQLTAIDVMWRWQNVPRDQHKIDAEAYSLDKYPGDIQTKIALAKAAFDADLNAYAEMIESQMPDQGYITSSTVEIIPIEHNSAGYMQPNELYSQISDQVWGAINIPKSMVTGSSDNSYASELLVSNYTNLKILQIAETVKEVLLENLKKRLLKINGEYPVDYLDIKLDFTLAATELDQYKQMAAMATAGAYTYDEIRAKTKHAPLKDEQFDKIVGGQKTIGKDGAVEDPEPTNPNASYPDTSTSKNQRATSPGMSKAEKSTQTE